MKRDCRLEGFSLGGSLILYSGSVSVQSAQAVSGRRHPCAFAEGGAESALRTPAGLDCDVFDRFLCGSEEEFRIGKTSVDDVLVRSKPGLLTEDAGKVVRTDGGVVCEILQ